MSSISAWRAAPGDLNLSEKLNEHFAQLSLWGASRKLPLSLAGVAHSVLCTLKHHRGTSLRGGVPRQSSETDSISIEGHRHAMACRERAVA